MQRDIDAEPRFDRSHELLVDIGAKFGKADARLPSLTTGSMPKIARLVVDCSIPDCGWPVCCARATILRCAEMSSLKSVGLCTRMKLIAGGMVNCMTSYRNAAWIAA
jgi:hypothetical protein